MSDIYQLTQQVIGPFMDRSVPCSKLRPGVFHTLSGVDGRYNGTLRKFYGMNLVVDIGEDVLTGLRAAGGLLGFRSVCFLQRGTSTVYHGFLVLWNENNNTAQLSLTLVYSADAGQTWDSINVFSGADEVGVGVEWDCVVDEEFLMVTVAGVGCRTVYYKTDTLVVIDSGPGVFAATPPTMTYNGSGRDTGENHFLSGDGTYQVAFRFYDSVRGVYSALSTPKTVTLNHKALSKATGVIYSNAGGGDSGLFVTGDVLTIGGRTYEVNDTNASSDVNLGDLSGMTVTQQLQSVVDTINADSSAVVYAYLGNAAITLSARQAGSGGNTITLSKNEVAPNTDDIAVSGSTLTGGGAILESAETNCQLVMEFPKDGATWGTDTFDYDEFSAMFDTVEVFRSINLGRSTEGAILYLEQSLTMPGTSGAWDALTVTLGTTLDEALVYWDQYDPSKDIVKNPPAGGAIGYYGGMTFLSSDLDENGGRDTSHSSPMHDSMEYFSTYNTRKGTTLEGRPLRYLPAGDVLVLLATNSVTHIQKNSSDGSLIYTVFHYNRGLSAKLAAHTVGNSILYLTNNGLHLLNSNDMNIGRIQTADGLLLDDWKDDLHKVTSGYDSLMDASYLLNPDTGQILQIYHSTQSISLLEEAWFSFVSEGLEFDGDAQRAYFATENGRVVVADSKRTGTGTMMGLNSGIDYTQTHSVSSYDAPYNRVYPSDTALFVLGDVLLGLVVSVFQSDGTVFTSRVASYDEEEGYLVLTDSMTSAPPKDSIIVISPVPFEARFAPVRYTEDQKAWGDFHRIVLTGVMAKFENLVKNRAGSYNKAKVNAYRQGVWIQGKTHMGLDNRGMTLSKVPSETALELSVDGVDVEPTIQIVDTGISFDLTCLDVSVILGNSRKLSG